MDEMKQYLTFKLDEGLFGVEVIRIIEILELVRIMKIPQTPDFMSGVINLRGSVVPVVDIKHKLGMGKVGKSLSTCIIVLDIKLNNKKMYLGILVDSVQEVFELGPENIDTDPKIGVKLKADLIKGLGKRGNKFIILLDISKIFSANELEYIQDSTCLDF